MENKTYPIENLDLSVRCYQLLKNAGIKYLNELSIIKRSEMTKFRNFGHKSLREVEDVMNSKGLSFMDESVKAMQEKRSCFTCKNTPICYMFKHIISASTEIEINIDGDATPGKWVEVFDAMGNCCLKYEKSK